MALTVTGLNVSIGKNHILHDINLEVNEGEFFCFLGSSGCGKSTLLKTISGFVQEQTGDIVLGDVALHELPPQKRGTIIVFQDMRLFTNMTVGENVAYSLRIKKVRKAQRLEEAEKYLHMVHLDGFSKRHVNELSGGQAQRVAIARALAAKPKLLLLDEPFSALDENLRDSMRKLVMDIHHETGITVIMVTHDQREALAMSDRLAVMDKGRIVQVGTPEEVYERPGSFKIAKYFADGDILDGSVKSGNFTCGGVTVPCGLSDGDVHAIIRQNAISIARVDAAPAGALVFSVDAVEYQGQSKRITMSLGDVVLHTVCPAEDESISADGKIAVSVDAERILFFEKEEEE